jgi:hypothetical protein
MVTPDSAGGAPPEGTPSGVRPPGHTFTENLRRLVRRRPDMGHEPVDISDALGLSAVVLPIGAVLGAVAVLVIDSPPAAIGIVTLLPIVRAHLAGVRHRWWALGAGTAAGTAAAVGLGAGLEASLAAQWSALIAILAGSLVATVVHAAVTHVPARRP